jgi:NADH:ubiquinone oxidoreductase subunit 2 (subunit N)
VGGKITKDVRELNLILVIMLFFFIGITSFYFVNNLLLLFLALELIGIVYYFFFLYTLSKNTLTVIKYKNLLSSYLWMSFFLLVFLAALIFYVVIAVGSLNFDELIMLCQTTSVL